MSNPNKARDEQKTDRFAAVRLDDITESLPARPLQWGDLCPQCGQGTLDYNGLLYLECPLCGYEVTGGAGCT